MGIFPEQFADIEAVGAPWALASYNDRQAKRHASTMAELESFYETVFPRSQAVLAYCDGFDIDACRHVRISNCSVNAPGDDAIVPAATPQAMFSSFWLYVQNEAPSPEQEAIIAELQQ